jgi:hypothetical protein
MHCDGFTWYNCKNLFCLTCIYFAGALYLLFAGCHLCSGQTSCKSILYFWLLSGGMEQKNRGYNFTEGCSVT